MVQPKFMPVSVEDMKKLNITQLDFVYVCGDAYVDHPSFGHAIIMRVLWQNGFTVGIIPQPDWHNSESIKILGKPRLGFLVSAGNIDSMVNHYTVNKKKPRNDCAAVSFFKFVIQCALRRTSCGCSCLRRWNW